MEKCSELGKMNLRPHPAFTPRYGGVVCDQRHILTQMTLRMFRPVLILIRVAGLSARYPQPPGDKKRRNDRRDGPQASGFPQPWGMTIGYPHIPSPYDYDDLTDSSLGRE